MRYAHDPLSVAATATTLAQGIGKNLALQWSILLDAAFDVADGVKPPNQYFGTNLYEADGLRELKDHAPWLMPLNHTRDTKALVQELEPWLSHSSGRPMLSVIGASLDHSALVQHLRTWAWAQDSEGMAVLLRLGDTRSLRNLATVLTPSQWNGLTRGLERWIYLSREGSPSVLAPQVPDAQPFAAPLKFSVGQEASLENAVEPDALLHYLQEHLPDNIPKGIQPSKMFGYTQHVCALATEHQLEAFADKFSLLQAACLTKGVVLDEAKLLALLQSKNYTRGELGKALLEEGVLN